MVRSRPIQRFTIKEGSGTRARVWVVPNVFLLDSEEGSSPTSSSWAPKTGLTTLMGEVWQTCGRLVIGSPRRGRHFESSMTKL
jgi:hypothetical protein